VTGVTSIRAAALTAMALMTGAGTGAVAVAGPPALPVARSNAVGMTAEQQSLETTVASFRGQMGVAAIDLRSGETIAVNADARFPTASTIKTAIMLEAWHQVREGVLRMDTVIPLRDAAKVGGAGVLRHLHDGLALTIDDLIQLMIVTSDNTATNLLVEKLGTARIDARLDAYGLPQTRLFRPTFRDGRADVLPDLEREFGLGMTTPREMARLMALIAEGKAVDATASAAMLATLQRQQDRAMIPRYLNAAGLLVGNKTGTDEEKHAGADGVRRHVRADAAIVRGPEVGYVIAIYARQVEDTRWGIDNDALVTGARVSQLVYERFAKRR
jgi:beta-lactamase class A